MEVHAPGICMSINMLCRHRYAHEETCRAVNHLSAFGMLNHIPVLDVHIRKALFLLIPFPFLLREINICHGCNKTICNFLIILAIKGDLIYQLAFGIHEYNIFYIFVLARNTGAIPGAN